MDEEKLLAEADIPVESKFSVPIPVQNLATVLCVRSFGDVYCVLQDDLFMGLPVNNPRFTFFSRNPRNSTVYPVTHVPQTRRVLGIETLVNNRTVVLCHYKYTEAGAASMRMDIYNIDDTFNATLTRIVGTGPKCYAGGMVGKFASPEVGEYVAVWADLRNNEFFSSFNVKIKSEIEVQTESTTTQLRSCALPFSSMEEVYPGPDASLFSCLARPVPDHADCLYIVMCRVQLDPLDPSDKRCGVVFCRVVRLPFEVHHTPDKYMFDTASLDLSIQQMVHPEDGTDRALINIYANTSLDDKSRTAITLLLHLQTSSVLDMYVHGSRCVCAIDSTGEKIVRFVTGLDVEEEEEEDEQDEEDEEERVPQEIARKRKLRSSVLSLS